MSEKEKKIVEKLKRAIPNMSDFDKGYILGKTEKMAEESAERGDKSESIKNWDSPVWRWRGSFYGSPHWRSQN